MVIYFQAELSPPRGAALDSIKTLLKKMQHVYAPREKLGHLLGAISHIYHAVSFISVISIFCYIYTFISLTISCNPFFYQ